MIPVAVPNIDATDRETVAKCLESGWVGPGGPFVEQFEHLVAQIAGKRWAIATITGSAALEACAYIYTYGRSSGGAVPVMEYAFPAMANIFERLNIPTAFVADCGINHDLCIYDVAKGITVADRAPALGEMPTHHDLAVFSFAANKIITCGAGGAIVGDGEPLALLSAIRQGHGQFGKYNFRMPNINAALGVSQLKKLMPFKEKKQLIWRRYQNAGLPMIDRGASRWMATVECSERQRTPLYRYMRGLDIEIRIDPFGISLPCSTGLTDEEQEKVITAWRQFWS